MIEAIFYWLFVILPVSWQAFPPEYIDPRLRPYYDQYFKDAERYGVLLDKTEVRFVAVKRLGYGIYYERGRLKKYKLSGVGINPTVLIDPDELDKPYLKEVVYHEITHSICRHYFHLDLEDSLMTTHLVGGDLDLKIENLFTRDLKLIGCIQEKE